MDRIVRFSIDRFFCLTCIILLMNVLFLSSLVQAADVSEINSRLDALQKEVTELKNTNSNIGTTEWKKGSFKLPGTNTSLAIGGFVKGTFIWSDKSAGAGQLGDQALVVSQIPVGPDAGGNEKSEINFNARQSQLWIDTYTTSKYGPVVTHLEGDFFSPAISGNEIATNSHGFRLRQAYGSIGPFTVGQFWNTSLSWTAFPEFLDFGGPVSIIAVRQVGARWTRKFDGGSFSVAAENPETFLPGTAVPTPDDDKFPDVNGIATFKVGKYTFDVSGVVRFLHIDVPGTVDSETGWGIVLSGDIPTIKDDNFKFQVHRGEGFGRYIGGLGALGDGVLVDGKIEKITTTGGYIAYRHVWTPTVRSNFIFSTVKATDPPNSPGTITNRASSVHMNLIWYPISSVQLGPEYMYGERRIESGQSGHIQRVQFSVRYNFF